MMLLPRDTAAFCHTQCPLARPIYFGQRKSIGWLRGRAIQSATPNFMPNASGKALPEPARDARDGFAHLIGRARVGEANEAAAMDRIEIDPRRGGDVGLFQHPVGEF